MSGAGALNWKSEPYSALCTIEWSAGGISEQAVGWLRSRTRLVTAGHVIRKIGGAVPLIKCASGTNLSVVSLHAANFSAQPTPHGASDYGVIEVDNVPQDCSLLNMVTPSALYEGKLCSLLAYDFDAQTPIWHDGVLALAGNSRFLHTAKGFSSCSGGPLIIRQLPVGTAAIGIYTDHSIDYNELQGECGRVGPEVDRQYDIATSLTATIQQQIESATT